MYNASPRRDRRGSFPTPLDGECIMLHADRAAIERFVQERAAFAPVCTGIGFRSVTVRDLT
jgi:hypothetical protein